MMMMMTVMMKYDSVLSLSSEKASFSL